MNATQIKRHEAKQAREDEAAEIEGEEVNDIDWGYLRR